MSPRDYKALELLREVSDALRRIELRTLEVCPICGQTLPAGLHMSDSAHACLESGAGANSENDALLFGSQLLAEPLEAD